MIDLAKKIVMDGEGASKFITVRVKNAKNIDRKKNLFFNCELYLSKDSDCGEDANWGRLVMAIGKTQIKLK